MGMTAANHLLRMMVAIDRTDTIRTAYESRLKRLRAQYCVNMS
jgi:hypothetical protein